MGLRDADIASAFVQNIFSASTNFQDTLHHRELLSKPVNMPDGHGRLRGYMIGLQLPG